MKKIARHILVFWLASTVLLSSTGLSIHHIYCYCKKESKTSLFGISSDCEQQQMARSCCQGSHCGMPGVQTKPHKCSDSTTEFVKLDSDYLLFPSEFKLHVPDVFSQTHFFKTWLPQAGAELIIVEQKTAPPPPFGKELLPLIQSFLC